MKARAKPNPPPKTASQRFWSEVRGYAEALAIAFVIVTFVFNTVGVVGSSMRPSLDGGVGGSNVLQSLLTGDRVFIPKYDTWLRRAGILGPYARGDIVVVREPANSPTAQERDRRPFFIKRVIGLPGDTIQIAGGQVIINGHAVNQQFISGSGEIIIEPIDFPVITTQGGEVSGLVVDFLSTPGGTAIPQLPLERNYRQAQPVSDPRVALYYSGVLNALEPIPEEQPDGEPFLHSFTVPEGHYFVMGDNRSPGGSEDSRAFGPVRAMSIAGKATAIIWPPRRDGLWNWRLLTPPSAFNAVPSSPQSTLGGE
jgi:signal peptidase I